jgi:hypothetical protein
MRVVSRSCLPGRIFESVRSSTEVRSDPAERDLPLVRTAPPTHRFLALLCTGRLRFSNGPLRWPVPPTLTPDR